MKNLGHLRSFPFAPTLPCEPAIARAGETRERQTNPRVRVMGEQELVTHVTGTRDYNNKCVVTEKRETSIRFHHKMLLAVIGVVTV